MDKLLQQTKNLTRPGRSKKRLSGLQLQVLSLYRKMLRTAETKPDPDQWKPYIRSEFKKFAAMIPVSAHQRVEYFLRQGHNKLEVMQSESVSGLTVFGLPESSDTDSNSGQQQQHAGEDEKLQQQQTPPRENKKAE